MTSTESRLQMKAFALGGGAQSGVQADKLDCSGIAFGANQGGGQLQGVGGAQWMHAQEPPSGQPDLFMRLNLKPSLFQLAEKLQR